MSVQVPETARYEVKFVAYKTEAPIIFQWLRFHWAKFEKPYDDRQINNVYFDNYDYKAYAENLSGVSTRTKVRYRWYGSSDSFAPGVLEVKRKRNVYGWKLRYEVPEVGWTQSNTWREIRRAIASTISEEGSQWLNANPCPVLMNRYKREYFVSTDGGIRVTVDTNHAVCDQRLSIYPNISRTANLADTVIVECKFDRLQRNNAQEVIQGLPLRISRHSKYMVGLQALLGR